MHSDQSYFEEKKFGKAYDINLLISLYSFTKPYKRYFLVSILLVIFITTLELALPYITKIAIDKYIVPEINHSQTQDRSLSEKKTRYLKIDLTDLRKKAIVKKYPDFFRINGASAYISFNNLGSIKKTDIEILRRDDISGVGKIALLFVGLVIFNFFLNFLQVMIMEYTGQMTMHDMRVRLFEHIQNLPVDFFSRNPVGRLVTRVTNDIQNMHELFTSIIAFVFKDIFLLIGIAIILLCLDWKLALISFSILPAVVYVSKLFSGQARDAFRTLRVKIAEINAKFSETIEGIKVIQFFLQERENYRNFKKLNHENYLAGMRQIHVFALFMPVIELLGAFSLAIVIFYGGGRVLSDTITLGALVAFISYMKMFFRPIRDIAEKYNIMQNAMASAERIFLIFDTDAETDNETEKTARHVPNKNICNDLTAESGGIEKLVFDDVCFSYKKNEPVLKGVSFKAAKGETIAIVGPTGSGKTTLINLIEKFYDPDSGHIYIDGKNITEITRSELRSKISFVMQDTYLFSGTIRDNIASGAAGVDRETMNRMLDDADFDSFIKSMPGGINTLLSEGGASISSGERQFIAISRACVRNPELIILDEATSYIDSITEKKIEAVLAKLLKGRTSIVIAHRLSTARNADRILVFHKGRIIETGTHDKLMAQKGFYFRLNLLQYKTMAVKIYKS
ncbi:MAG: ABC transporter ATP-binding protein [Deltaproteobacteria bacterium]|nr:ABC transporter ATP-binding protein [Deltaproteobacteria bacterium]